MLTEELRFLSHCKNAVFPIKFGTAFVSHDIGIAGDKHGLGMDWGKGYFLRVIYDLRGLFSFFRPVFLPFQTRPLLLDLGSFTKWLLVLVLISQKIKDI